MEKSSVMAQLKKYFNLFYVDNLNVKYRGPTYCHLQLINNKL